MEFLYINEKNMKVSLSGEELRRRGLTAEELDRTDARTKHLLREMLEYAHDEIGFDARDVALTVRIFPSSDGGCELFVTKNKNGKDTRAQECADDAASLWVIPSDDDALYALCERLHRIGYIGESALYCERCGQRRLAMLLPDERALPLLASHAAECALVYRIGKDRAASLAECGAELIPTHAVERLLCVYPCKNGK